MSASRKMQGYDPGPRAECYADWPPEYEDDDLVGDMTPSMHSGRAVGRFHAHEPEVCCQYLACSGVRAHIPVPASPRPLPADRVWPDCVRQAEYGVREGHPPEDYYDDYDGAPWEAPLRAYPAGYIPYPPGYIQYPPPRAYYHRDAWGRGDPYGPPPGHSAYSDYVDGPRVRGPPVQQRVMRPASAQQRSLSWTDVDVVNSNSYPQRDPLQRPYHSGGRDQNHYPAVRGFQPLSSGSRSQRPMSAGPARRPAIFTKNRVHPAQDDGGEQEPGLAVSHEDFKPRTASALIDSRPSFELRPTSDLINRRPSSAMSRGRLLVPENSEMGTPSRAVSGGSMSAEDRHAGDAGEDEQRVSYAVLRFTVSLCTPPCLGRPAFKLIIDLSSRSCMIQKGHTSTSSSKMHHQARGSR